MVALRSYTNSHNDLPYLVAVLRYEVSAFRPLFFEKKKTFIIIINGSQDNTFYRS